MLDVNITCCQAKCRIEFPLSGALYEQVRRTGQTFYCPNGHAQSFTEPTTVPRKHLESMERERDNWRRNARDWERRADRAEQKADYLLDLVMDLAPNGIIQVSHIGTYLWVCPECQATGRSEQPVEREARRLLVKHYVRMHGETGVEGLEGLPTIRASSLEGPEEEESGAA